MSEPLPRRPLLSRYAGCLFWLGRYMERAENLARLLDVTYTFTPASKNGQNWQSVVALHCDEEAYSERYGAISAENVIRFYLTDITHTNSILFSLQQARMNASQLRPLTSTEMWVQVNMLYNYVKGLAERSIPPQELWHVLSDLRRQCQTFTGITEGGLYRDESWYFHHLGRLLERADQTTRLLDIKYHLLLPSADAVGGTIDASQWFALLRAASGYHAFRRAHPYRITPGSAAGFLLLDPYFPRSVYGCVRAASFTLKDLQTQFGLEQAEAITDYNNRLKHTLKNESIDHVIAQGLHEYLDAIQLHLATLSTEVAKRFF